MITVIADDLTGAAEIAGICLRYGLDVSFGIDNIPEKKATINVIATDTRSKDEDEAYETHFHLAESILSQTKSIIFKKCDSVLRGHVLIELLALADAEQKETILIQPSNPQNNRFIKDASYYIDDVLIENTGFTNDPEFPAKTSSVKKLILDRVEKQHTIKVSTGAFKEINSKGIFIPNCESVEDLATCLSLYKEDMIIAGSAAFFEQFLIKMKLATSKVEQNTYNLSSNYLLVSGSTHPTSIAFSKILEERHVPLIVFPEALLENKLSQTALNEFVNSIAQVYKDCERMILRVSNNRIQLENSALNLKIRMSLIAKKLIESTNANEVFIEGGATAYDLLEELHWKSFTPISELASGVVRMQYDNDPERYITIKPGSYEWPYRLLS
jgi:D-threonate/D-erythronate kinase